jgi:hypothetical protein
VRSQGTLTTEDGGPQRHATIGAPFCPNVNNASGYGAIVVQGVDGSRRYFQAIRSFSLLMVFGPPVTVGHCCRAGGGPGQSSASAGNVHVPPPWMFAFAADRAGRGGAGGGVGAVSADTAGDGAARSAAAMRASTPAHVTRSSSVAHGSGDSVETAERGPHVGVVHNSYQKPNVTSFSCYLLRRSTQLDANCKWEPACASVCSA